MNAFLIISGMVFLVFGGMSGIQSFLPGADKNMLRGRCIGFILCGGVLLAIGGLI